MKCVCGEQMFRQDEQWVCPRRNSPSHPIRVTMDEQTMVEVAEEIDAGPNWAEFSSPLRLRRLTAAGGWKPQ